MIIDKLIIFRGSCAGTALVLSLLAPLGSALAQTTTNADTQEAEKETADEIIVTGRNFRSDADATATKLRTPISETAASIAVLDQTLLNDVNATDFRDAIELIPGVTSAGQGYGNNFFFIARGFGVNGDNAIKINGAPLGSATLVDAVAIERLEFVKGSSAVAYGEVSAGGFLNLATRQAPRELSGEARLEADTFGALRGQAFVGGPINQSGTVRVLVGGAYENSDEFYDQGFRKVGAAYGTVAFDLSDQLTTTLYAYYDSRSSTRQPGLQIGEDQSDPDNPRLLIARYAREFNPSPSSQNRNNLQFYQINSTLSISKEANFVATVSRTIANNRVQVVEPTGFDLGEFVDLTPGSPTFGLAPVEAFAFGQQSRATYAELRFQGDADLSDAAKISYYVSGEYRQQTSRFIETDGIDFALVEPVNIFDQDRSVGNPFTNLVDDGASEISARFLSISAVTSLVLRDKLRLNFGIRHEGRKATDRPVGEPEIPLSNTATNYNASIGYSVTDNLNVYYAYGQSTEYLSARRCDLTTVNPETGRSHEIGVKWDVNKRLLASVTAFDSQSTNAADTVICPVGSPLPTANDNGNAKQFGRGVELELIGAITPQWNIISGFTYIDDGRDDGTRFVTPKYSFSLFTVYDFAKGPLAGFGVGLGLKYDADRPAIENINDPFFGVQLGDYVKVDAALYYKPTKNINLALNFDNILDKQYYSSFGDPFFNIIRQPGRSAALSLTYTF
jgi:iron complex outermembrane recepter protein